MSRTNKSLQKLLKPNGVTLVALVITITILIILSTVTISAVMGENGLVSQAKLAKDLTANSTYAEAQQMNELLAEYANVMQEDSSSEITGPDTNQIDPGPMEPGKIEEIIDAGILDDTTTVEDNIGNEVVIPGGFGIAEDSGTSVEDGIVIEDSEGNQFVWIPTGTYHTSSGDKINELTRRTFTSTGETQINGDTVIDSYYYGEGDSRSILHDTINNFLNSAKPVSEGGNGGFYIGRYEQGTGNVCKAGVDAYVNLTRDQAKTKAEEMYSGKEEVKATSELISSYAWDTALNFICQNSDLGYNLATTTSTSRGNIGTSNKVKTGQYPADCYSNIYDLLGNCFEYTTEYSSDGGDVYRGSSAYSTARPNTRHSGRAASTSSHNSFRINLYV